jgi:hypothetical protein
MWTIASVFPRLTLTRTVLDGPKKWGEDVLCHASLVTVNCVVFVFGVITSITVQRYPVNASMLRTVTSTL